MLLLERGRLQHEVLLLGRIHLLQVLGRGAGRPVQRLLDHLGGGQGEGCAVTRLAGGGCGGRPFCRNALPAPSPPNCSEHPRSASSLATGHHALGSGKTAGFHTAYSPALVCPHIFGSSSPLLLPNSICFCGRGPLGENHRGTPLL